MKDALYIPIWDEETDTWCVQTEHGFESRDIGYVAGEFSGSGLIYHFYRDGEKNHEHSFNAVLREVLRDSGHIDIITDYGEYSEQKIRMIEGVKRAVRFAHFHRRPMTNAELRENNRYEITSLKSTNTNETGKGPFFLLITGEEWNHDDDRWLGIYVDKKDARELTTGL